MSKLTAGFQSYGENLVTVETTANVAIKALDFDGTNENVDFGNDSSLQITDDLSVVIWVEAGAQGTNDYLCQKFFTNQMSWAMRTGSSDSTKLWVQVSTDGTTGATKSKAYESATGALSSGWHQVGLTFGSSTLKVYVDGVDITATMTKHQDPAMSSLHNSTRNLEMCGFTGFSGTNWVGEACNLSIWDTGVLSATDWSTLYNGGNAMDPADLTPTGSAVLVSSWLWNTTLPLVPGASDVPDNTASNDGTTQNMEVGDVVDSPFTTAVVTSDTFNIAAGFYVDDEAFRSALETAVQVTFASLDIFKPGGLEPRWLLDNDGTTFTLTWDSDNARTYMGFTADLSGASEYYSDGAVGSTWYPINGDMSPVFSRIANRRTSTDHTGWSRSAVVGRHDELRIGMWIEDTEAKHAFATIQRFIKGARGKFRMDAANATAWAWSAAGWDGEMTVALTEPSRRKGFSNYLSRPWIGVKEITLDFVRWV